MFTKLKNLFISRTIRASAAGIIASIAGMVGLTMTEADVQSWVTMAPLIVTTITSLIAIAGRTAATGPIALASLPSVLSPILKAINGALKQREID